MTFSGVIDLRMKFWGNDPGRKEAREKIRDALLEARRTYLLHASLDDVINPTDFPGQLCFKVGGLQVCEKAFANIVGMADGNGFKNKVWVEESRNFVESSLSGKCGTRRTAKVERKDTESSKLEHAYAYILKVVESNIMDKSAHAHYDNHSYLPYHSGMFI